jgi:plasmid maintenance system killer protein
MIKGIAKSVAYDVGDPFEEVKTLSNKWVAVHVNGDWRIIFPLWTFSAVLAIPLIMMAFSPTAL